MSVIKACLSTLIEQYLSVNPRPAQEFDADWRSPCETGEPYSNTDGQQVIAWAPKERAPCADFSGLENALDTVIHEDTKAFYASFWSGNLETNAEEGPVNLIQLWNFQDVERLIENQLGHAFAQKQSKSALSIFIATTDPDSELFIAVRNNDGVVQLEKPGYKPVRELAPCLNTFLASLTPRASKVPG